MTRLLLDANVSPALAAALRWRGHDALHVNDLGLRAAPDDEIFRTAATLGRAVVTHDGDYLYMTPTAAGEHFNTTRRSTWVTHIRDIAERAEWPRCEL